MTDQLSSEFIDAVREFWLALNDGRGSNVANSFSAKAESIVDTWKAEGVSVQKLVAVLALPDAAARYGAAASLLKLGENELALPVLREIANDTEGLIAPTAKLLLYKYKNELPNTTFKRDAEKRGAP